MKHLMLHRTWALLIALCLLLPTLAACGGKEMETTASGTSGTTEAPITGLPTTEAPTSETPTTEPYDPTEYAIWYDLDGGIDPFNPEYYTAADEVKLAVPLRIGYRFLGWEGTDLDEPTLHVTIPKGSRGEREYTALWEENAASGGADIVLDTVNFGKDDGVAASGHDAVSTSRIVGNRGEGVYLAKTVYTDVTMDGKMDNAYTYGVHWRSDMSDSGRHTTTGTYYDAYIVRSQDGRANVFVKVHDTDIAINDELWKAHYYRCDSIHVYYEMGSAGLGHSMWTFAAEPTKKYTKLHPENWTVVMTEDGYNVEFSFDNAGQPFVEGDELGISIYLNDCYNYENINSYKKDNIKASTRLNPVSAGYKSPDAALADTIRFSFASATGNPNVVLPKEEDNVPTGDFLLDMMSRSIKVGVIMDADASPWTRQMAKAVYLRLLTAHVNAVLLTEGSDKEDELDFKIIFGITGNDASVKLLTDLAYNDYGFGIYGEELAVYGATEENLEYATELLISFLAYAEGGGSAEFISSLYSSSRSIMSGSEAVPKLEGVDLITDAGDNSYHLLKHNVTAEAFSAYCQALEDAGFRLYTTNRIGSLSCVTYYNAKVVVNATLDSANGKDLRVVVDHRNNTALPPLEVEEYTPKFESTVTLLDPNNLTQIIRLDNGEFLVIDSGTNGQHKPLYDELVKQSHDGKPVVAAWIFTHFHQDHNGGFVELVQRQDYMDDITIKAVIYNNPAQQIIDLASPLDQQNMSKWDALVKSTGAKVYQARTGQKYVFANAEIEFLFTYEDLMPFYVTYDRSNPTSMIFSVALEGQRIIFTGDASREGMEVCIARYGDYLKADFVQLSHHGGGDGGSPIEFYRLVGADYVFVPGDGNCATAEKWACDNAKKVYVRAKGTVTLTLPFKG